LINTVTPFMQNYTRSLPTVCVAWNFTAGKLEMVASQLAPA